MSADPRRKLTPPAVAKRLGVGADKILLWIRAGELRAVNVATRADGRRPRWVIDLADLEQFEAARSNDAVLLPRPAPCPEQIAVPPDFVRYFSR